MRGTTLYTKGLLLSLLLLLSLAGVWAQEVERPPLESSRIAVIYGSNYEMFAESHFPDAELYRLDFFADILELLGRGSVDYAIYNISTLEYIVESDERFEIVDESLFTSPICYAFNPEDEALRDEMNEFLSWFIESEEYADIADRWRRFSDGGDIPEIEILEDAPDLVVGLSGVLPPFSLIKNNVLEGFDVEILKHFALHNGYRFSYFSVALNFMINALQYNVIDVAGGGMAIVDERRSNVIFSDSYDGLQAGVLVRTSAESAGGEPLSLWGRIKRSIYVNVIEEDRYDSFFTGIYYTFLVSLFSLIFGTMLGLLMVVALHFGRSLLKRFVRFCMAVIDGIPLFLLLLICFYVIFVGSGLTPLVVCGITFSLHFAVSVCKMLNTAIARVNVWETEAARAMGFSPWGTFVYIIAPQAVAQALPLYKNVTMRLVKLTSIVGCTSLRDMTKVCNDIRCRTFDAFTPLILTTILYIILAYLITRVFDYVIHHTRLGGRHLKVSKWSRVKHGIWRLHRKVNV